MSKRVILTFFEGDFTIGFPVQLRIRDEQAPAEAEFQMLGHLPPAPNIPGLLQQWQDDFRSRVGTRSRATARRRVQSFSDQSAQQLEHEMSHWLNADLPEWRQICDLLQQQLNPRDDVRVILQTENTQLRQLPWQAWTLFKSDYPRAEIVLSATRYQSIE